jgi:small-conductance mechanosensitive channel
VTRLFLLTLAFILALNAQPAGTPVLFEGQELLRIQAPNPPYSPEDRARDLQSRLAALSALEKRAEVAIVPMPKQGGAALMAGGAFLIFVTAEDAAAAKTSTLDLAQRWADILTAALHRSRQSHSLTSYLLGGLKSIAAWLLFAALCWLVVRGGDWAGRHITGWTGRQSAARRARGFILVLWNRAARLALWIVKVVIGVFLLFQFSFVLSFTFSQFPQTAGISTTLLDYLKAVFTRIATAFFDYLPSGGIVLIVVLLTVYALRGLNLFAHAIEHGELSLPGLHPEMARPTYQLVRILASLFALVIVFPYLPGSGSDAFRGVSLLVGILISFGSGSSVSNIVAGVVLTYMRPFKVGDRVSIAGTLGDVIEKTLLVTRVRTPKNVEVVIPNSAILAGQIENFSAMARSRGLILHTTITIGYDAPWQAVHQALIDAALATEAILPDPRPFVLQTSLNDFHVSYELNAYTNRPNEFQLTYARLHANIQDSFNRAGIEIMSPNYFALRDGNTVTIPPQFRPPDYQRPGFRVEPQAGGSAP